MQEKLSVVVDAVAKCSQISKKIQGELVHSDTLIKQDRSPVTVADYVVQVILMDILRTHFPDIPILAEENNHEICRADQKELRTRVIEYAREVLPYLIEDEVVKNLNPCWEKSDSCYWTIDPIDGTKGFLRGGQYAIAVSLIREGRVDIGVLGCPSFSIRSERGCIMYASRGNGARIRCHGSQQSRKLRVSQYSEVSEVIFCESFEPGHTSQEENQKIGNLLNIKQPPLRMDSQCKYGAIASGLAGIYLRSPSRGDYQEKVWDHAAGSLLVEEAGGVVTDLQGLPLDFSLGMTLSKNKGVVASNGQFHSEIADAVKMVKGKQDV